MNVRQILLLKENKTVRQTMFLFTTQIFVLIVSFAINILLIKQLGPLNYGILSFAIASLSFLAIFFEFGYFSSGARILANNNDKQKEKQIVGALIIVFLIIAIFFVAMVFGISFIIDDFFKDKIGYILRTTCLLSLAFTIPFFMELLLKGTNNIGYLSLQGIFSKIIYILFLIILYAFNILSPVNILLVFCVSTIAASSIYIYKLRPDFKDLKQNILELRNENRAYGKKVYWGRIIDVSTYNLDRILISYFIGAADVGLYAIAYSIAGPINLFSSSLSSSKFKDFSNGDRISKNVLRINFILILIAMISSISLGYLVIHFYLGKEYYKVFYLLIFLALAIAFQAGYQSYNAWLSSTGYGNELRISSYITGMISVIGNIILIPMYGAMGAAVASILSTSSYFIIVKYYYKKVVEK